MSALMELEAALVRHHLPNNGSRWACILKPDLRITSNPGTVIERANDYPFLVGLTYDWQSPIYEGVYVRCACGSPDYDHVKALGFPYLALRDSYWNDVEKQIELEEEAERLAFKLKAQERAREIAAGRIDSNEIRSALLSGDEVEQLAAPEYLIDKFLVRNTLAQLYAPSGNGKSFVAVDWAMSISGREEWLGHKVMGGPVLYVIGEGAQGMGKRRRAWREYYEIKEFHSDQHWYPKAIDLTNLNAIKALCEVVSDIEPVLIIFDTQSRCTPGYDENGSSGTSELVGHLDMIRNVNGACVLLLHHTGWEIKSRGRGHSGLQAAIDTEIGLYGEFPNITLRVTKQKDDAPVGPLNLMVMPFGESMVVTQGNTEVASHELRILEVLDQHPSEYTRSQLIGKVGRSPAVEEAFDALAASGAIVSAPTQRPEGNREVTRELWSRCIVQPCDGEVA